MQTNTQVFFGGFGSQQDIEKEFEVKLDADINILFAEYWYGDYEGDAMVVFMKDGQLFEVHGSHCSCMGLEDQWCPEATTWKALRHVLEKGFAYRDYEGVGALKDLVDKNNHRLKTTESLRRLQHQGMAKEADAPAIHAGG